MLPLRDHNPSHHFPIIVVLIIIANLYGFYKEFTIPNLSAFLNEYALVPAHVAFTDSFLNAYNTLTSPCRSLFFSQTTPQSIL